MRNRYTLATVVVALALVGALSTGCSADSAQDASAPEAASAQGAGGMGGGMGSSGGSTGGMVNGVVAARSNAALDADDVRGTSQGIVVDRVIAPREGWLVARSTTPPFSVLGTVAIAPGENAPKLIRLTAADGADALVALHIDRGAIGTFEFDPDRPRQSQDAAVYVNEAPVQVPVKLTGFGADVVANSVLLLAKDQRVSNRSLVIDYLITPEPVWIRVNLVEDGLPARQLGLVSRPIGEQQSVVVPLNGAVEPGDALMVTIHADRGRPGAFDFDAGNPLSGSDQPFVAAGVLVSQRITAK